MPDFETEFQRVSSYKQAVSGDSVIQLADVADIAHLSPQ
jgi:hypothetical protein